MGRTKKAETSDNGTKSLDAKSKAIDKAKERVGREKAQKSYREPSDSEPEVEKYIDPKDRDFSDEDEIVESASDSDWAGESSGSEYGSKKKTPKSGKGRGRPGRKAAVSPKKGGRGRGRPAKNGSPKKAPKRGRDDSESESEAESSGSEYGKKAKKPSPVKKRVPAPKKVTPKRKAAARAATPEDSEEEQPRARRGRVANKKSYKEVSEDDIEEVSEEEKKPVTKRAKLDKKEVTKKDDSGSEKSDKEDQDQSMEEDQDDLGAKKNGTSQKETKKDSESEDDFKEDKDSEEEKEVKKPKLAAKAKDVKEKSPVPSEDGSVGSGDSDEKVEVSGLKNKTDTDYSKIDFKVEKKTPKGDEWNFKISCWNIGGIKSWIKKNGLEYLRQEDPDVMCLNEVKCNEKTKPEEVTKLEDYPHTYWSYNTENSGHSGVAIFSKVEAKSVEFGFGIEESDSSEDKKAKNAFNKEGRMLTVEYDKFFLINAYVPNSGRQEKTDKFPKGYPPKIINGDRQKFDRMFIAYVKELEKKKPVIVTGDLNVSHEEIDLANPKTNERTAGFTKEEREGMSQLLEKTSLFDSFRALYPEDKAYTFWSYMHNSRLKNIGWRLDYFLLSEKLRDSLCESKMRSEVYGSDHCPIVLCINN